MEKPLIFLQSLLVLLVTTQIISACKCDILGTLMEFLCANQTLVMATALDFGLFDVADNQVEDSSKAVRAEYYMQITTVFNKGKEQFLEDNYFVLITTINEMECGVVLELETDYIIAAGKGHALHVNSCDFLERVHLEDLSNEDFEIMNDLVNELIC